jgi:hypothetical protein
MSIIISPSRFGFRAPPPLQIIAFDGFSTTQHWASVTNAEPQGSAGMSIAMIVRYDALPTAIEMFGAHGGNSGADGGWSIGVNAADVLRGIVVDAGGTARVTPAYTFVAGDLGKCHTLVMTHDGAAIRMYRNKVIVGTSTACVGYMVPISALKTSIGCAYNGASAINGATGVAIVGMAVSEGTVLDAAGVTAWHDACVEHADIDAFAGTQYIWRASENIGIASPWTDGVAGIPLNRVGTAQTLVKEVPVWA